MDIVAVTVWDEEEVSILDGEKLNPVICGFVVSDDDAVFEIVVENPRAVSSLAVYLLLLPTRSVTEA